MPMMPMEPANAVSRVRAFLVSRLLKLRERAVSKDMEEWPRFLCTGGASTASSGRKGGRVGLDDAVAQTDDAGGIPFGELRIVCDHDDKAFFGNFLQQVHDLNTGLAVQCTGGLVRQQDVGIVHQSAGDGDTLHLTAGHLARPLVQLVAQAHLFQCLGGPAAAFRTRNAGNGQCQLHVGEHRLVGNQIVALEHKTNGVVAIGVPVAVGVFFWWRPR